jgi:Ca2+-binding RTX toxin-like protein
MKPWLQFQILMIGFTMLIVMSVVVAAAAANTVPAIRLDDQSLSVTANDLKPASCAALYLTNIVSGSGTITGTNENDLIIGGPGNDTIDGLGGDDCILADDGDDTIDGSSDTDVCIGGSGDDIFSNCETTIQ